MYLSCLAVLFVSSSYAQYQAANWVVPVYRKVVTIKPGVFSVDTLKWGVGSFVTCSSISTNSGELLAFSAGQDVREWEGNYIEDGWNLCNPGTPPQCSVNCSNGLLHMQGTLFLPVPSNPMQYHLFIKDKGVTSYCQPSRVTATLIDMSYNNSLGKVIEKAVPILDDTLSDSRMTACKHANGRDWWLINHEYKTNRIYTHLITPDSILGPYSQSIGANGNEPDNNGWSAFSPSGALFATATGGMGSITLLDFDRCNGEFSNYRSIPTDSIHYASVLAFSPNGRFLYVNTGAYYLYQYDLQDIDIASSCVELFHDSMPPYLGMMSLMPDGKIYMPGWSGSTTGLDGCFSVVNEPDLKAPACNFQIRSVCIPGATQIIAAPNHPNYNLGELVGSGCDTITGTRTENQEPRQIQVYPNPASGSVQMQGSNEMIGGELKVYNVHGRVVKEWKVTSEKWQVDVSDWSKGLYVVVVTSTKPSQGGQYKTARAKLVVE